MRVTAQELANALSRLPAAHRKGNSVINIAIQGNSAINQRKEGFQRADLRVITFRKHVPALAHSPAVWELELA